MRTSISPSAPAGRAWRRAVACIVLATFSLQSWAWNLAGHMTSGAIAFIDLEERNPAALARTLEVLRAHPHYESMWLRQAQAQQLTGRDLDMYLFMAAARWPDDMRKTEYHIPLWHYVNMPYKPPGQPAGAKTKAPKKENLFAGYAAVQEELRDGETSDADNAINLCWMFHLTGDAHQPLHSIAMFSETYPNGDQGGNLQYVDVR